jgi:hypothetical protein
VNDLPAGTYTLTVSTEETSQENIAIAYNPDGTPMLELPPQSVSILSP